MIQWQVFLSVPKHYNPYSGNFVRHASLLSSVTRVTVEEKSNFKCITSVKLAFLSFNLPPILVEGLCMHGLIQKYFLHN